MICKMSTQILTFISKYITITPEMKDIYQYGIDITISSILNVMLVLLCSLSVSDIFAGLIYLFIFIFLRSFTGGFHATTYFRCNFTIIITFLITFVLYKTVTFYEVPIFVCGAVIIVNLIPIILFSPVPNKHKSLTDEQKKRSYILSILIAFALSLIGLTLFILAIPIGVMVITTVTTVSVLILIEIIMQRRGYHEG